MRARDWNARQPMLVTYTLMAINIGVFIWMASRDSENVTMRNRLTQEQIDLGLNERVLAVTDEWYRLVTSGFLHFGIIHIAFNMLLLFQLGSLLEPVMGRVRFALLYFAALLGGSAGILLLHSGDRSLHGGASGAVFGLLGAAAVIMYQRGVNPMSTGIGTTIALNLFITFTIPNISIGGHVGGLVAGAAAGWFVAAPRHKGFPLWLSYVAPAAVAVAAAAVSYLTTQS